MPTTWVSNGADTGGSGGYVAGTQSIQYIHDNFIAPGDIITAPATTGSGFTWNTGVAISKSVSIQGGGYSNSSTQIGAGSTPTTITRGSGFTAGYSHIFEVLSLPSDVSVRISGFNCENVVVNPSGRPGSIVIWNEVLHTAFPYTKIRIDHCTFHLGFAGVWWTGWCYGVVDHCLFNDVTNAAFFDGIASGDLGNDAWSRGDWQAGSANFPFFEDCTFNWTNTGGLATSPWAIFHNGEGARSVIRHCTIDSHTNTTGGLEGPVDMHGNQTYWANTTNDYRGSIRMEFYNNTVHQNSSSRTMDLRGGSQLIHDNSFVYDTTMSLICTFRDEEDDNGSVPFGGIARTGNFYPCEDQINASFVYNNTVTPPGQAQRNQLDSDVGVATTNDTVVIQKNRDYWTVAPSSTTTTSYAQPHSPPSNTSYPTAYIPVTSYATYTYPHPLVTAGGGGGGGGGTGGGGSGQAVAGTVVPSGAQVGPGGAL